MYGNTRYIFHVLTCKNEDCKREVRYVLDSDTIRNGRTCPNCQTINKVKILIWDVNRQDDLESIKDIFKHKETKE